MMNLNADDEENYYDTEIMKTGKRMKMTIMKTTMLKKMMMKTMMMLMK